KCAAAGPRSPGACWRPPRLEGGSCFNAAAKASPGLTPLHRRLASPPAQRRGCSLNIHQPRPIYTQIVAGVTGLVHADQGGTDDVTCARAVGLLVSALQLIHELPQGDYPAHAPPGLILGGVDVRCSGSLRSQPLTDSVGRPNNLLHLRHAASSPSFRLHIPNIRPTKGSPHWPSS